MVMRAPAPNSGPHLIRLRAGLAGGPKHTATEEVDRCRSAHLPPVPEDLDIRRDAPPPGPATQAESADRVQQPEETDPVVGPRRDLEQRVAAEAVSDQDDPGVVRQSVQRGGEVANQPPVPE